MPVPKRKRSRVRRDKRFANKGIAVKSITFCKTCKNPIATHVICDQCGHYKGVKVLRTKNDRLETRTVLKQMKASTKRTTQPTNNASEQSE